MRNSYSALYLFLGLSIGTGIGYLNRENIDAARAGGRVISGLFMCCIDYPFAPCTLTPAIPDCRMVDVAVKGDRLDLKDTAQ